MTNENLNIFESVFKRAIRNPYKFKPITIQNITLVSDLEAGAAEAFEKKIKAFIGLITDHENHNWHSLHNNDYHNWETLKSHLDAHAPDLIISYRLLQEAHETRKFSLGALLDTMTQAIPYPVLLIPAPEEHSADQALQNPDSVMVVTDDLDGDHRLVNYGVHFTEQNGTLTLVHLEDKDVFDYYISAISKIPEINTDTAEEKIRQQLLDQPNQYIDSVTESIKKQRPDIDLERVVGIGHVIDSYRDMLVKKQVDLLIFNTKDYTQLAMHSLGYSLAVEFKDTPMLLI